MITKKFLLLSTALVSLSVLPARADYVPGSGGGGVSSVTATSPSNGFTAVFSNPTTAPNLVVGTNISGMVKGNGTGIGAAVAGTDYQAPITITTTGTSGPATFIANVLNIPSYTTGGGGITAMTVVGANGFAGTVANPTSTPAITVTTTVTGIAKGNGTALSAAVAGTDYVAPTGSGAGLTALNASNISSGTVPTARLPVGTSSAQGVLQVDGSTVTASAGVVSVATPYTPLHMPSIGESFTAGTATGTIAEDYTFGTAATAPCAAAGCAAITTLSQLDAKYTTQEPTAGTVITGTTMAAVTPNILSYSNNYVFNTNNLTLTATLNSGQHVTLIAGAAGNSTGWATGGSVLLTAIGAYGATTTANMWVGEVLASAFYGPYVITAIPDSTHVTAAPLQSSPTTIAGNFQPSAFYNISFVVSNGAETGSGPYCYPVATLPTSSANPTTNGVIVGNAVYYTPSGGGAASQSINASDLWTVVSKTSTQFCMSSQSGIAPPALATGTGFYFIAATETGQIVDKISYLPPGTGAYLAEDVTVIFPDSKAYSLNFNPGTQASNTPIGAWTSNWWYRILTCASGVTCVAGTTELDAEEVNYNNNINGKNMTANTHDLLNGWGDHSASLGTKCSWTPTPSSANTTTVSLLINSVATNVSGLSSQLISNGSGALITNVNCQMTTDLSQPPGTVHHIQMVWTGDSVINYLDGDPIRIVKWQPSSNYAMHAIHAYTIGALNQLSGLFAPIGDAAFPSGFAIQEAKIITQGY